jgi:hypothetical protein
MNEPEVIQDMTVADPCGFYVFSVAGGQEGGSTSVPLLVT